MTEDEAKKKACFVSRDFYAGRDRAPTTNPRCIGSGCMAWRWNQILNRAVTNFVVDNLPRTSCPTVATGVFEAGPMPAPTYVLSADSGYCGAAGGLQP